MTYFHEAEVCGRAIFGIPLTFAWSNKHRHEIHREKAEGYNTVVKGKKKGNEFSCVEGRS